MRIETCLDSLIAYAMNRHLAEPVDHQVLLNRLLDTTINLSKPEKIPRPHLKSCWISSGKCANLSKYS